MTACARTALAALLFAAVAFSPSGAGAAAIAHRNGLRDSGRSDGGVPFVGAGIETRRMGGTLEFIFRAGFPDGIAPRTLSYTFEQAGELWLEYSFKYSGNFQWHTIMNKHIYLTLADDNGLGNWFIGVRGDRHLVVCNQISWGRGTTNYYPNTAYDPAIERNRWYKMRVHALMNTPGAEDGIVQVWLDGRLVIDHRTIPYRSSSQRNLGWGQMQIVPVWGGYGGEVKSVTDRMWFDRTILVTDPIDSKPDHKPLPGKRPAHGAATSQIR